MEDFEYFYEDDDDINDMIYDSKQTNIHSNYINIEADKIIYPAVINDLEDLKTKKFEEKIIIESLNEHTLDFNIFDPNEENIIANFTLEFNNKYPFEAPKLKYSGPKYDFYTNLKLTFDFKKISQLEWSIKESIYTILIEILNIISIKNSIDEEIFWNEKENIFINFLKEIGYFKNISHFEENKSEFLNGKGIGYSKNSESNSIVNQIENSEKQVIEMFSKCVEYFSENLFTEYIQLLELPNILTFFIEKSSYLYISKIKDSLLQFKTYFNCTEYNESLIKKINVEKYYSILENSPNIIIQEDAESFISSHFYKKEYKESNLMHKLFKRIFIDIMDLNNYSLETDICRFMWCPEMPQFLKIIITSENEPYLGGMFEFHAFFPNDYPSVPPKVHLMTTGGNLIRFNPNLYAEGKVCLSLLGTWSGEQWCPVINNFVHIVQAISVMILTDQPVQNEPAYSSDIYFDYPEKEITSELLLVRKYKYQIKYYTLQLTILNQLKSNTSLFYPIYQFFYNKKKEEILKSFEIYLENSKKEEFYQIKTAKSFQSNSENLFNNYSEELESLLIQLKNI